MLRQDCTVRFVRLTKVSPTFGSTRDVAVAEAPVSNRSHPPRQTRGPEMWLRFSLQSPLVSRNKVEVLRSLRSLLQAFATILQSHRS